MTTTANTTRDTIVSSKLTRAEVALTKAIKLMDEASALLADQRHSDAGSLKVFSDRQAIAKAAGAAEGSRDWVREITRSGD